MPHSKCIFMFLLLVKPMVAIHSSTYYKLDDLHICFSAHKKYKRIHCHDKNVLVQPQELMERMKEFSN